MPAPHCVWTCIFLMNVDHVRVNKSFTSMYKQTSQNLHVSNALEINLTQCVKSVRIQRFSGPHFSAFGPNTEIFSVNQTHLMKNVSKSQAFNLRAIKWIWRIFCSYWIPLICFTASLFQQTLYMVIRSKSYLRTKFCLSILVNINE